MSISRAIRLSAMLFFVTRRTPIPYALNYSVVSQFFEYFPIRTTLHALYGSSPITVTFVPTILERLSIDAPSFDALMRLPHGSHMDATWLNLRVGLDYIIPCCFHRHCLITPHHDTILLHWQIPFSLLVDIDRRLTNLLTVH